MVEEQWSIDEADQQTICCTSEQGWDGIAAALHAARPSQTVLIESGPYRGRRTLQVADGITVRGSAGAVLEWAGEGSALLVNAVEDVTIIGLEVISIAAAPVTEDDAPAQTDAALIHVRDCHRVRIRDCTCRDGGLLAHGIYLQRSEDCSVEGSDARGCRNGLVALSSTGLTVRENEWSANKRYGVALGRDPTTPTYPSEAELIANRCHDNAQSGIAFFSSQGRAEGNDCWGNQYDGIALQRAPGGSVALIADRQDEATCGRN